MSDSILLVLAAATSNAALPITQSVTWFGPNDYPPEAMRAGEEGAVRFALKISANGAVTGCDVVESSGSSALDMQTCALALRRAKFEPAADGRGNRIASTFTQRTRWVIPHPANEAADTPFGPFFGAMNVVSAGARVRVDATGKVVSCTFSNAANTTINPCDAVPIGKTIMLPSSVNGKPVGGTASVTVMVAVKPDGALPHRSFYRTLSADC